MSRRTEIRVEIERRVVVRKNARAPRRALCELCRTETEMVTADNAARLAGCSSRAIFGWVERGRLHFTETDEKILLVCRNSLGELLNIK